MAGFVPQTRAGAQITAGAVDAYRIPTEAPEGDGTARWDATVLVVVELEAGGQRGLGYTYASAGVARIIDDELLPVLQGQDALSIPAAVAALRRALRNLGIGGASARALSAVDVALWDLKARILGVSLLTLLGAARERVAVYGSGGFVTQSDRELDAQLGRWADAGFQDVKLKVGRNGDDDVRRVRRVREAVGPGVRIYVDANGAWTAREALAWAHAFGELDVRWFEEPVSSDDLIGLRQVRQRAPVRMEIAAGEYGFDRFYFERMLHAEAVDVLQVDATRCCGVSGFLEAAALCASHAIPLSSHTAPALHTPLCQAAPVALRPLEWFHDHVRIERALFDGAPTPLRGEVTVDLQRPGLGLVFKRKDAERFRV